MDDDWGTPISGNLHLKIFDPSHLHQANQATCPCEPRMVCVQKACCQLSFDRWGRFLSMIWCSFTDRLFNKEWSHWLLRRFLAWALHGPSKNCSGWRFISTVLNIFWTELFPGEGVDTTTVHVTGRPLKRAWIMSMCACQSSLSHIPSICLALQAYGAECAINMTIKTSSKRNKFIVDHSVIQGCRG